MIGKPNYQGIGYTGHVQDGATGLTYMQQRYYDPQVGLFLSVDPVTAHSDPVGQFHRYRYANGNPYKFTDPDGRRAFGHQHDIPWWNVPAHIGNWFAKTSDLGAQYAFTGTQEAQDAWVGQYKDAGDAIVTSQTIFLPGFSASTIEMQGLRFFSAGQGLRSKAFFEGATYQERVLKQTDAFHAFPKFVDGVAREFGKVSYAVDRRGGTVEILTVRGEMEGSKGLVQGTFEYIKNQKNEIYHRLFRPDPRK